MRAWGTQEQPEQPAAAGPSRVGPSGETADEMEEMGIDPEFLAALPPELQAEVLQQQRSERGLAVRGVQELEGLILRVLSRSSTDSGFRVQDILGLRGPANPEPGTLDLCSVSQRVSGLQWGRVLTCCSACCGGAWERSDCFVCGRVTSVLER